MQSLLTLREMLPRCFLQRRRARVKPCGPVSEPRFSSRRLERDIPVWIERQYSSTRRVLPDLGAKQHALRRLRK